MSKKYIIFVKNYMDIESNSNCFIISSLSVKYFKTIKTRGQQPPGTALGMVAEWSKMLIPVPWPLIV